jgi:hypothetical protein
MLNQTVVFLDMSRHCLKALIYLTASARDDLDEDWLRVTDDGGGKA